MQYCPKCKMKIRGYKVECPLCQGRLSGEPEDAAYPILKKHVSRVSILKIVTFLMLSIEIILFNTRFIASHQVKTTISWIPFVMAIVFVAWLDAVFGITLRNNILKVVTFEAYVGMVVCFIADKMSGYKAWSVTWAIPFVFIGIGIFTFIMGLATHAHLEDYMYYLVFSVVCSQAQWIFVLNEKNFFMWPAVICMTLYLLLAVAVVVFRFRDFKNASAKMWNF